jgi:hypothetical protein
MADRQDISQYPTDQGNENDLSFYGDTDMVNHQIQEDDEAEYATAEDMTHYIAPEMANDYLRANGEKFRVRTTRVEKRSYSRRIVVPTMCDSGPGTIAGFAFRELTGADTATVTFHDGIDANATVIFELNLAANESSRDWYGSDGISYRYGLYVNISAGSAIGNLFSVVPTHV